MPGAAVAALLKWKEDFLKDKVKALDDRITHNNARIAHLKTLPDTEQQIESFEHINAGLEADKKDVEEELSRFKNGSDGKKYNMAKRNIGNKIHRLQKDATAADLTAAAQLIDIEEKATAEMATE